jgi:hypothetical protein
MSNNELAKLIAEAREAGPVEQKYVCKFCNKPFMRESTLASHLCEPKRRHQQKDQPGVRLGYQAWLRFYEITQLSSNTPKTYEAFTESPYYSSFIKFGIYLTQIRAIDVKSFIDFVIKNNKKLDHWTKDTIYDEYLFQHLQRESAQAALERAITETQLWAEENGSVFNHFFLYATPSKICAAIINGRISPWVVYNCDSGRAALEKLDTDQQALVYRFIDPEVWLKKLKMKAADAAWCAEILKEAGF